VGLANLGSESESCVGSRVHLVGVFISFEKNFYRLPFTPPLWFVVSVLQGWITLYLFLGVGALVILVALLARGAMCHAAKALGGEAQAVDFLA
jgi:hypothetical protein